MLRKLLIAGLAFGFVNSMLTAESTPGLSAAEIVSKNVAARGGLNAWRAVQTLSEAGKLGAGGDRRPAATQNPSLKHGKAFGQLQSSPRLAEEAQLPFQLELERPRKERIEIQFNGKTAVQVYDGTNGWKVRPYLNRLEVENYTEDEQRLAALQADLDGPLVDYAAKGSSVALEGMEKVDDRDNYRLKLTMKGGRAIHVWIDAKTFLETKIEGAPRRLDGLQHPVEVYYGDYRTVDGLVIPFLLETKVLPIAEPGKARAPGASIPVEKIAIEKVQVNPKLDAALFKKPVIEAATLVKPH